MEMKLSHFWKKNVLQRLETQCITELTQCLRPQQPLCPLRKQWDGSSWAGKEVLKTAYSSVTHGWRIHFWPCHDSLVLKSTWLMGLSPLFLWCRWTLVWQFFLYDWLCCWTYLVTRNSARTLAPFVRISNNSIQNVEILTSFFKQSIQCYVCIRAHMCTCTSMGMPYHL